MTKKDQAAKGDALGDRMKAYEGVFAGMRFDRGLPVVARIDGRSFSSFTRGLNRPFDAGFRGAMLETARFLVESTDAKIAYTQSDEISLVWEAAGPDSQIFFDGRVLKMASNLASLATVKFLMEVGQRLPAAYAAKMPTFDARVWTVPTREEAANTLLWREIDAVKNSVSMAARGLFSHKQLTGKKREEMIEMMRSAGFEWSDLPVFFRRGSYLQRKSKEEAFSKEELESLPEKHEARLDPTKKRIRSSVEEITMPEFSKVKNRADVIFEGAVPVTEQT